VKQAIQAKEVDYKAWLHNKAEYSLHLRYAAVRKSAALKVKKTKMHSWDNFGYELDSNYWQVNKVF